MKNDSEKRLFANRLRAFASTLGSAVSANGEWTMKGFIDVYQRIYPIANDAKIVSKALETHLFPQFVCFARNNGFKIEFAKFQNWYPDLSFILEQDPRIKFAVDLKTTYRYNTNPDFCKGFTLGSHGEYFVNRTSLKNIQYPYDDYSGHFCLGIIYTRSNTNRDEGNHVYRIDDLTTIPSIVKDFVFFAEEKWKIASDKGGSGNTANIGSVKKIDDLINGNGVFAKAGEELFDDYWINYGKIEILVDGKRKKLSSFGDYLKYRGLPAELNNPKAVVKASDD